MRVAGDGHFMSIHKAPPSLRRINALDILVVNSFHHPDLEPLLAVCVGGGVPSMHLAMDQAMPSIGNHSFCLEAEFTLGKYFGTG